MSAAAILSRNEERTNTRAEKHETAGPIVRQSGRHPVGDAACLEMARKEGKTDQKQKQVRDENPFMLEMGKETRQARAFVEAGAQKLLEDDGAETGEGGGEAYDDEKLRRRRAWRRKAENRPARKDRGR